MYRTIMIKPAGSACNLHCSYCFYLDEVKNRRQKAAQVMEDQDSDQIIEKTLQASDGASFVFQGGEPTLAGAAYFRHFFDQVDKVNTQKKPVSYALQTNGWRMEDALLALLKQHDVLVGVSVDGPRLLHDLHRKSSTGEPTFTNVRATLKRLEEAGIPFNILSVVTDEMADNADMVMRRFLSWGVRWLQFIPCLDPLGHEGEGTFLHAESYLRFLEGIWPYWAERIGTKEAISVRLFDNWLTITMGGRPEACGSIGICSQSYVAECDGSIYPCDFYCLDRWKLGDIGSNSLKEIDEKRKELRFVESSLTTNDACRNCPLLPYCGGGCRRYRDGKGIFVFCQVYRTFLGRHLSELEAMAKALSRP